MDFPTNNTGFSSSSIPERTYDIFLSFRGEDTRYGFTGSLYNVLHGSGVYTFMDDEELSRGEEILRELPKAIEESRISIVVFSEKYATSKWCLDELVKILECKKSNQQMVLPIFFNVDAGEVRNQTGNFGKAMDSYLQKKGFEDEKVERWRKALNEAANLAGWPCRPNEYEYRFIQSIVKEVLSKLDRGALLDVAEYPVGIDSPLRKINMLLQIASDDVRMLGICGLGGIGKTTIAKAVYNSFVHHFEGHASFLANVRETSKRENDLVQLQDRLLSDMFREGKWKVPNVDRGINIIKERLCGKKVILILDDVDHLDQLEKLAVRRDSFGKGSIVIITTRNEQLFIRDHFIKYEVEQLNFKEACRLFSWHAFKGNKSMADYAKVVACAIRYANGHPLALKVLGSYLSGFDSKSEWVSALDKCKKTQSDDIYKILKISFDGLDKFEKFFFLDIAFFFKGVDKDNVETTFKSCGFLPKIGIATLIKRCLITVNEQNLFWMHDMVQQMAWKIVEEELGELKERSRLSFDEDNEDDVLEVLGENEGLNKIQGIMLDFPEPKELQLSAKVFELMKSLRVLIVRNAHFFEGFEYLPNELRWLDWANYHFPLSFNSLSKKLVVLNMPCSHIILKELVNKKFEYMTDMNLSRCEFIEKVPDILGMATLKNLDVSFCENLVEVHESVGSHNTLVSLDLHNCPNLRNFPSSLKMEYLEVLNLSYCSCLEKVPNIFGTPNLKNLNVACCKSLVEVHESVGSHNTLVSLDLHNCPNLQILPSNLKMKSLQHLFLQNCSRLEKFPNILERMESIKELSLKGTAIKELPSSIKNLTGLEKLKLMCCKLLQEIPELPPSIRLLDATDCVSLNYESRCRLLSEEFNTTENKSVKVPGTKIPGWFPLCRDGVESSISCRTFGFDQTIHMAAYAVGGECCNVHSGWFRVYLGVGDGLFVHCNSEDFKLSPNHLLLMTFNIIKYKCYFLSYKKVTTIKIKIESESPGAIIKELGILLNSSNDK